RRSPARTLFLRWSPGGPPCCGFSSARPGPAARAKKLAEEIGEAGPASAAGSTAEIETAEIKVDVARGAARAGTVVARGRVVAVEAVLVIHLALLGVGENVVGFLQLFEFFFGRFVAGIQVRMVFAGQLPKGGANVFGGRFARHAEEFVVVGFCRRGHRPSRGVL